MYAGMPGLARLRGHRRPEQRQQLDAHILRRRALEGLGSHVETRSVGGTGQISGGRNILRTDGLWWTDTINMMDPGIPSLQCRAETVIWPQMWQWYVGDGDLHGIDVRGGVWRGTRHWCGEAWHIMMWEGEGQHFLILFWIITLAVYTISAQWQLAVVSAQLGLCGIEDCWDWQLWELMSVMPERAVWMLTDFLWHTHQTWSH